tara:strand:+ start:773 stop:1216 length:444 start_codon:yes stop_codon:yes gene_type:complete
MMDEMFTNLTTIGKLGPGDKLAVDKGKIYISSTTYTRPLCRYFCKQDRYSSIDFVKSTVDYTLTYAYTLLNLLRYSQNNKELNLAETETRAKDDLRMICDALNNTLRGLDELKGTYQNDRSILSIIDVITNKLRKYLDEYNDLFSNR